MNLFLRSILVIALVVLAGANFAQAAFTDAPTLEALLNIKSMKKLNVRERAIYYADIFLHNKTPYVADPLGEGSNGEISKAPLYRFDGFDCTTFVETVLGLSFSNTPEEFEKRILQIRYKGAEVDYETRNHFTSIDWIPNNAAQGFVKDITGAVAGKDTRWSQTWIDKASWFAKKGDNYVEMSRHFDRQLASYLISAKKI